MKASGSRLLLNRWVARVPAVTTTRSWFGSSHESHEKRIHGVKTVRGSQPAAQLALEASNRLKDILAPIAVGSRRIGTTSVAFASAEDTTAPGGTRNREWRTFLLSKPSQHVAHIQLNRPKVKNAFGFESASELIQLLDVLEEDPGVRCVLLSGFGPDFTSGVDLKSFMTVYGQMQATEDVGRRAKLLRGVVEKFQAPFKRMESFSKPLLCVQHGLCYGLGMELAACSDVRYCSADTRFSIREVLIGIAADVGSLQKMPHLVNNQSLLRELIYTGRDVEATEAQRLGFVSSVWPTKEEAVEQALKTALTISRRSPVAVQGSKQNLRFSADKSFQVGLDYNAVWNMCMMQSGDVVKAIETILSRGEQDADYEDF